MGQDDTGTYSGLEWDREATLVRTPWAGLQTLPNLRERESAYTSFDDCQGEKTRNTNTRRIRTILSKVARFHFSTSRASLAT